MKERARFCKGELQIRGGPGQGTVAVLRTPFPETGPENASQAGPA
jgi:nitrate/nitrite-specific signal transduction histidine kinase